MPVPTALGWGLFFLLLGVALMTLVWAFLRWAPRWAGQAVVAPPPAPLPHLEEQAPDIPIFVVRSGGRVVYLNEAARSWFLLQPDERPSLEFMARRARPPERFLERCAVPGEARLMVAGRMVEMQSFPLPMAEGFHLFITLRPIEIAPGSARSQETTSTQALEVFGELVQAMTARLDLEPTILAVLESVDRLLPSDFLELTLWDAAHEGLVPYRFIGVAGLEHRLERPRRRYRPDEGFTGYLVTQREPLLVRDLRTFTRVRPALSATQFPFRSYVGVPIQLAGEVLGTLELASAQPGAYDENDLRLLQIIAAQAAVAIHNALIYTQTRRQLEELHTLAEVAQAVSRLQDPVDFYRSLVEGIQSLMRAEIVGFLRYDPVRHELVAQAPFTGVPEAFVAAYRSRVNLEQAALWLQRREPWVAEQVPEDPGFRALGLADLARGAGMRDAIMAPLWAGDRLLGFLQMANKQGEEPFSAADIPLARILAGQVVPLLENAELLQEARKRALRAEALRRIANLVASEANQDEILRFVLREVAQLLQARLVALFLLDESEGVLRVHRSSLIGVTEEQADRLGQIPVTHPSFRFAVTRTRRPFRSPDIQADSRIVEMYRPFVENFPEARAAIVVPLVLQDRALGEMIIASDQVGVYDANDVQLALSIAGQLALAVGRRHWLAQADPALARRADEVQALLRLTRELTLTTSLEQLLAYLREEAVRLTGADCASLRLAEGAAMPGLRTVWVCPGQGDELTPEEQRALNQRQPVLVEHWDETGGPHPGVRSALAVPLVFRGESLGVLYLHAARPRAFDEERQRFARALGLYAALALGIALERQQHLEALATYRRREAVLRLLRDFFVQHRLDEPPEQLLGAWAELLARTSGVAALALYTLNNQSGLLEPLSTWGAVEEPLPPLAWDHLHPVLDQAEHHEGLYVVPRTAWQAVPVLAAVGRQAERLVLMPLRTPQGQPLGLVVLGWDEEDPADPTVLDLVRLWLASGNLLVQWHQLRTWYALQHQTLEEEARRAQTAARVAEEGLPRWFRKDLDQLLDINTLARRTERLEIALDVAALVNRQPDRISVFQTLGHHLIQRMGADVILVVERMEDALRLVDAYGRVRFTSQVETLLGQYNPLQEILQRFQAIAVGDIESEDSPWRTSPLLRRLETRAFIALPIGSGERPEAGLLALFQVPLPPFTDDDIAAFTLLGRQVGIALQNLNLLRETSRRLQEVNLLLDFSRQLGELDPQRVVRTLVHSALAVLHHAHAGYLALWDEQRQALQVVAADGYVEPAALEGVTLPPHSLPGEVLQSQQARWISEVDFAQSYPLAEADLLAYQQATAGRLPVSALLVPVPSRSGAVGVLVLENFNTVAAFNPEDAALVGALARQTGLALENARLLRAAEQRAAQLAALTNVATIITSTLSSAEVRATLLPQLAAILPYDAATLWLREGDTFVIDQVQGFEDEEERRGLRVQIEDSRLLQTMTTSPDLLYIPDTQADQRFPWPEGYPYRSWLGIPLVVQEEVQGVLALEKRAPYAYGPEQQEAARVFGAQAAAALRNAQLYEESLRRAQELDERTQRLEVVYRFTAQVSASLDVRYILALLSDALLGALPVERVSAFLMEGERPFLYLERPGEHITEPEAWPAGLDLLGRLAESQGVLAIPDATNDPWLAPWQAFCARHGWRNVVFLPLVTREQLQAFVVLHLPPGRSLRVAELDLARSLAQQAAVALQNARLYEETRRLTEALEERVAERTRELTRAHHRAQTLLRVITELAGSLDLDTVLNRTLDILNSSLGAEQSTILLVNPGEEAFYLRAARGYAKSPPPGGRQTTVPLEESLAGWIVRHREPVLIPDLRRDPRWKPDAQGKLPEHRSAIGVPLLVGEEVLGVFFLFHREPGYFEPEHLELAQATARQVAVAINNAELFRLIRDQAERLGKEVREREVEASRAKAILEAVADGILVTDAQGVVTVFNASAERILGLPAERILGQRLDRFGGLFGPAAAEWFAIIQRWSENPASYEPGETHEQRLELPDGRVLSIHLAPVFFRNQFLGTVSVFRDITHQVEVDRLKSEFVATVSHELRTPMTAIKGYVEILLMGAAGPLNEQQTRFLEVVRSNTERLSILVNDLLDISRIEAGRVQLSIQAVDLAPLVEEVITEMRRLSEEEGRPMTFEVDLPDDLPPVKGDPERIRQIIENLVDNGYRYTPEGGRVLVRARRVDHEVQVDVIDNGIGIPPDEQERVFERFYRGENPLVMASAGTGLGLSIVRHFVEVQGGRIWLTSTGIPGEGSTFSFTLPIYREETEAQPMASGDGG